MGNYEYTCLWLFVCVCVFFFIFNRQTDVLYGINGEIIILNSISKRNHSLCGLKLN